MLNIFKAICICALISNVAVSAKTFIVSPNKMTIQIPVKSNSSVLVAAKELQKHLQLITGVQVPVSNRKAQAGKYAFYVGIAPSDDKRHLQIEEARYRVTPQGVWLYGQDRFANKKRKTALEQVVDNRYAYVGTMFAVYNFLDRELKVRWPAPGDNNIICPKQNPLRLKVVAFDWIPKLKVRRLWSVNYSNWFYRRNIIKDKSIPKEFKFNPKQQKQKLLEEKLWQRRMRMGQSIVPNHRHAFVRWWDKYSKSHPEFFALNSQGERKPLRANGDNARVCMCVSNPDFQQEIVKQWLIRRKKNPYWNQMLNICENDCGKYCRCPECKKLDVVKKGEPFGKHMTDRYIAFANSVLKIARKHVPDVKVCMFAYQSYRFPPRKTRIDKDIVFSYVPKLWDSEKELDDLYKGWRKMGAEKMLLRTNGLHIDIGLPMGFEKTIFRNYKVGVKNNILGVAYDAIHGYWPSSGIVTYILARGIYAPEKSFEYWEQEYYDTYGKASPYIKKYYRYWRNNIWEKRIYPNRLKIVKAGFGFMRGGLYRSRGKYYSDADFDKTDAILQKASACKLKPEIRKRVNELILANEHARKLYHVMKAGTQYNTVDFSCVKKLHDFRLKNRDKVQFNWGRLMHIENRARLASAISFDNSVPVKRFANRWFFQIDPKNVGLKEHWEKFSYQRIKATWDRINVLTCWEHAFTHPDLMKLLKKYDGIGWYAQSITISEKVKGKKLYIRFGAVDESCWVYVNGKEVGKHLFKKSDDWKTPFKIRIDQEINWKVRKITVVVRVEDKAGAGGIWKPVWLVTDK